MKQIILNSFRKSWQVFEENGYCERKDKGVNTGHCLPVSAWILQNVTLKDTIELLCTQNRSTHHPWEILSTSLTQYMESFTALHHDVSTEACRCCHIWRADILQNNQAGIPR